MLVQPSETVFYLIEKAIKQYRKLAQQNISDRVDNLTLDQVLLLQFLVKNPELSQSEIAELIFKDNASVTRMIALMVKNKFLKRKTHSNDRRRFSIELTSKTKEILPELNAIIISNRAKALHNISQTEINNIETTLNTVIKNCSK
ncbi:MAG: MarR family transcriptional regulator [Flavobacteriaceae bacterium]|nr:MAG: MarR family transcriptional regulator [Flavobacteriaceae bacterium]